MQTCIKWLNNSVTEKLQICAEKQKDNKYN